MLTGVDSVEIDRERRWVYIGGDVEPQLLMDYLTQRTVKPDSVKLIYYCSKEATAHHQTPTTNTENHVKDMPSDHTNDKREGENSCQDHHTGEGENHYAPCKDWVHRRENYVAQPQKQDLYHPSCECRNPSCDFHAWKRQGSTSRFNFDMAPPLFYGYHHPIMGHFPYM